MNKRILFCVETTQQADTDYPYIRDTIEHFYIQNNKIAYRPIYMKSKSRYKSRSVQEEIKQKSGTADTTVIYCVDTDEYDSSPEDQIQLEQIRRFCENKGYEFIFFCKDIEDVYCGGRMPNTQKIPAIKRFRSTHAITNIKSANLSKSQYKAHCSNILNILDKYWKRKE